MLFHCGRSWLKWGSLAAMPLAAAVAWAEPGQIRLVVGGGDERVIELKGGAAEALSDYWLGLELGELPALVKEQLDLKGGVAIEAVVPDSPAAKAGLKAHDILLKAGDKLIAAPTDLLKIVAVAKDKELALTVLRGGKEKTINVTPAQRPAAPEGAGWSRIFEKAIDPRGKAGDGERAEATKLLEEALAKLRTDAGKAGGDPVRMFFARPGIVGRDVLKAVEFPKNLTVRITKEGDQPAKIHVKRDDQEWETTADKLTELPEDIRVHVQPMVEGGPVRMAITALAAPLAGAEGGAKRALPAIPALPELPAVPAVPRVQTFRADGSVEAKLDAILKKLEQKENEVIERLQADVKRLEKQLDELREKK